MNLNFLASFVDLCETFSFSQTARRLNTVQPVISRQIKELEQHIGYPLFVRTKKEVKLTTEGIEFKNKIAPIYLGLMSELQESYKESSKRKTILKIGCTIEAGENLLYPVLKSQFKQNSSYQFHISLIGTDEILKKMSEGEIDLGIVTRDPLLKGTTSFEFIRERQILIGPAQSLSIDSLDTIPLVTYRDTDYFTRAFLDRNFSKNLRKKISVVFSVNSHRLMIDYVKNSQAFAVIPYSSAKEALQNRQIKIHAEDKHGFPLKLVFKNNLNKDARKLEFIEWLMKKVKSV